MTSVRTSSCGPRRARRGGRVVRRLPTDGPARRSGPACDRSSAAVRRGVIRAIGADARARAAAAARRRRSRRRRTPISPATRCSARSSRAGPGCGCRARSTAASWRSAPCSASRCRSPPRARSPGGWWRRPASRSPEPRGALTHLWPRAGGDRRGGAADADAALAPADAGRAGGARWPAGLRLDPEADRPRRAAALLELPGIGPWTAEYVAMRALGDPDAGCRPTSASATASPGSARRRRRPRRGGRTARTRSGTCGLRHDRRACRPPTAPHMPGYGIAGPDAGLLPWSWAEERLCDAWRYWVVTSRRRRAARDAGVGGVARRRAVVQHRRPLAQGAQPARRAALRRAHRGRRTVVVVHGVAERAASSPR